MSMLETSLTRCSNRGENMNGNIDRLIEVVTHQQEIYTDLLKLAIRKKDAITRGDINELDYVVEGEELLLMKLGEIESERHALLEITAKEHGMDVENLTIKNWPDADKDGKKKLLAIQETFFKILENINEVNNTNQRLINLQLNYIKHVIDETMSQSLLKSYNVGGTMKQPVIQDPRLVDIRM